MQHTHYSANGNGRARSGLGPLETVLRAVRRHWALPIAVPVLVIGATAITLNYLPRVYDATAQLRIDQQRSNLAVLDALKSLASGSHIEAEIVVLRSMTLAESVIDSLSLQARLAAPRRAQRAEYFEQLRVLPSAPAGTWMIRPDARSVEVVRADGPGEPRRFGAGETLRFDGVEAVLTRAALTGPDLRLVILPRREAVRQF